MELKRGDIILVAFPFTDLTSSKVRPAIIISPNPQGDDVIIAFISSVVSKSLADTEFLLISNHPHFAATGLKKDSVFKMGKLLTPTPESHVRKSVDKWLSGIGVPTPRRGRRSSENTDALAVRPWSVTVHKTLVLRYLGHLSSDIQEELNNLLKKALGLA